jgi:hypothetical protein
VSEQEQFWFNLSTGKVEKGLKSKSLDRIGPFKTESEAAKALEIVKSRTKQWQEEEESEN